mgnify:CR=1 FL=1
MPEKLLSGEHHKQCVKGSRFLSSFDRDWELLISSVGPCRLNISLELEPYQALIKSVIYQQLRPTTASTILNKFKKISIIIFQQRPKFSGALKKNHLLVVSLQINLKP